MVYQPGSEPELTPVPAGASASRAEAVVPAVQQHPWADALNAAAEARDEDRFLSVVQIILQEPDDAVVRLLAPYLPRPGGIGRVAAHGLLMLGMPALEALISALDRGEARARVHAAWALGSLRHPEASEALMRVLEDPATEPALADACLDSLAEIADRGSMKRLVALLQDPSHAARRPRVCRALGFIGDQGAIPKIAPLLANPKAEVRLRAAEALVRLLDRRGWPVLFEVLRGDAAPGDDAAAALRALGDLSSAAPLLLGEGDNGYELRRDAAEVLGTLGDPRAVGPLASALADPNPWVRGAAVYALGRLGDRRMLTRMARMLDDASDWVKISAARALGLLGDPGAKKPLDKALINPNREVAAAVQDALDALAE